GILARFNHRGDRLVSNDWSGLMRLWDVETGRQLLAHRAQGTLLQFRPDDLALAADFGRGRIRLFRIDAGIEFSSLTDKHEFSGHGQITSTGRLLAVHAGSSTVLVDLAANKTVAILPEFRIPLRFGAEDRELWTYGTFGCQRWPITSHADNPDELQIGPPER